MEIDRSKAHSARVWNFWLGGKDWYEADRAAGEQITRSYPGIVRTARYQRLFLSRVVRFLAQEAGVRQFLDLGAGLPTVDNTHEVAQRVAPGSRIVYVDNDPMVLVHARALMTSAPEGESAYVEADVRDPERILAEAARTLDFSRPIALMMLGILGNIPDEDHPAEIVRRLLEAVPSGSYLAVSDGVNTNATLNAATDRYNSRLAGDYTLRSPAEVAAFFDGLEILEPGVVTSERWRTDLALVEGTAGEREEPVDCVCGLGVKH